MLLDRERCIQCARCTRFAEEVAGEAQIDFAGRGERVEVADVPRRAVLLVLQRQHRPDLPGRRADGHPYRFTARPWDLDQVESTCTGLRRRLPRRRPVVGQPADPPPGLDSDPVNHGWLCDKGRFAFESVNGDEDRRPVTSSPARPRRSPAAARRLTEPMVRKDGELVPVSWGEALAAAADGLTAATTAGGAGAVALHRRGPARTNEGAYAWAKLAKGVLGTDSVDAQLGDGLPADLVLSLPRATIDQACAARTVVLLSGDVREELPVLFLRLREAAVDGGVSLVELPSTPTALTPYAAVSLTTRPGDAPDAGPGPRGVGGRRIGAVAPRGPAWSPTTRPGSSCSARRRRRAGSRAPASWSSSSSGGRRWPSARAWSPTAARRAGRGPARRPGSCRPCAAATSTARSTWAWPPGCCPAGSRSTPGADWFAGAWGAVARAEPGPSTPPASWPRWPARGEASGDRVALVLLGADPLGDFPDHDLAARRPRRAPTSSWP